MAADPILVVNAGSSSLKLRLLGEGGEVLAERNSGAAEDGDEVRGEMEAILGDGPEPAAAGHRVVHGGAEFTQPTLVDPHVMELLERLSDLAPLHNPPAVAAMRALGELRPGLPAVACFDTAFHASLSAAAATYAIPAAWRERHPLRRFGFHGLSHAYASRRAAELLNRDQLRLVTAHLGAGASLAAVQGGRSVDTTMGFTPLEGVVMATRGGSIDPGLLLWLQRHDGIAPAEMERALTREAGLLALSGRSGDMREVIAGVDEGDERCLLAFDVYVHRLVAGIAAMAAAMGGIDALVFTGGIGENSPRVRDAVAKRTGFLGIGPDAILVVPAREDLEIARGVRLVVGGRR